MYFRQNHSLIPLVRRNPGLDSPRRTRSYCDAYRTTLQH